MKEKIEDLIGKTITKIDGLVDGGECVDFYTSDGSLYQLFHDKSDGEMISLIEGLGFEQEHKIDVDALIGSPVRVAEVSDYGNKILVSGFSDLCLQPYYSYGDKMYHIATKTADLYIPWFVTSKDEDHGGEVCFEKIY